MDAQQARDDLAAAHGSQMVSRRPKLPSWQPPVCGLAVAAGFGVLALAPSTQWWRLAGLAIMMVCWGGAGLLILGTRSRQGIKGVRGATQSLVTTIVAAAVVVFFSALNPPSPGMRWIYTGLGIVVGAYVWLALRRQVRR